LNVDTALGAVVLSNFLANILTTQLTFWNDLALFMCVAIIYNYDHLNDVSKLQGLPTTRRHQFYDRHFKSLKWVLGVLVILGLISLPFQSSEVLLFGLGTIAIVLFYFALLKWLSIKHIFFKEVTIAVIYAIGVLLAPVINAQELWNLNALWLFGIVFFIALLNLLAFSYYDQEADQREAYPNIGNFINHHGFYAIGLITNALLVGLTLFSPDFLLNWAAKLTFIIMGTILVFILFQEAYFIKDERFRVLGEAVFFVPLLYFLFS
jgi:hypothetical protein